MQGEIRRVVIDAEQALRRQLLTSVGFQHRMAHRRVASLGSMSSLVRFRWHGFFKKDRTACYVIRDLIILFCLASRNRPHGLIFSLYPQLLYLCFLCKNPFLGETFNFHCPIAQNAS